MFIFNDGEGHRVLVSEDFLSFNAGDQERSYTLQRQDSFGLMTLRDTLNTFRIDGKSQEEAVLLQYDDNGQYMQVIVLTWLMLHVAWMPMHLGVVKHTLIAAVIHLYNFKMVSASAM